jgi:hypothetical protein
VIGIKKAIKNIFGSILPPHGIEPFETESSVAVECDTYPPIGANKLRTINQLYFSNLFGSCVPEGKLLTLTLVQYMIYGWMLEDMEPETINLISDENINQVFMSLFGFKADINIGEDLVGATMISPLDLYVTTLHDDHWITVSDITQLTHEVLTDNFGDEKSIAIQFCASCVKETSEVGIGYNLRTTVEGMKTRIDKFAHVVETRILEVNADEDIFILDKAAIALNLLDILSTFRRAHSDLCGKLPIDYTVDNF